MGKSHNGHADLGLSHLIRVRLGAMLESRGVDNKALKAARCQIAGPSCDRRVLGTTVWVRTVRLRVCSSLFAKFVEQQLSAAVSVFKLAGMRPGHVKGFAVALLLASLTGDFLAAPEWCLVAAAFTPWRRHAR